MEAAQVLPRSKPKLIWVNILFFIFTGFLALMSPFYVWRYGLAWQEIALFALFTAATGLSITVGYHRYFAHRTFEANPVVNFLVLFFGAAAFEQSALYWASQHRDHHRYVDTDRDPYNIKKGFFYAHIGWLIFWEHTIDYDNVRDLQKNKLLVHQNDSYLLWAVSSGVLLPLLIGFLTGHLLGALLVGVGARLALVHHSTFSINSVCHTFGKATYDIYASARDHWFVAFLTNGEGYHNFHHRFAGDYRNGVRWYQWDPSKWAIAILAKLGLAWDLKRVSRFSVLHAKLAAEHRRAHDLLLKARLHHRLDKIRESLKTQYDKLLERLSHWETISNKYQSFIIDKASAFRAARLRVLATRETHARHQFRKAYREWAYLIKGQLPNPELLSYY
ncbi:MAG: hypothetical protein A3C47_03590 [Omnitrophica bacterium RIFCSPHIGHO2_02_FULL_51_18]|nr:MAG: hypothetical protein A3C47_03590 [Omnitrophica bacterium RIFCSPHIGHO2_02_FULL_51_18]